MIKNPLCSKLGRLKGIDITYIFAFVIGFIFILYKCRFGFGNIDESFYLTVPYRLTQGDGLFADEYHLSQMSAIFLYPIMKLYLLIFKTTDGILLAFRYIFTVLHSVTALFLYLRLKKVTSASFFISLLYLIFTPFGIMALSYNSMGLAFLSVAAVLVYTAQDKPITYCLAGLFFAGSVLCCPYLVAAYIYYFIIVLVKCIRNREFFGAQAKNFLFFTLGCFILAIIFFIFVLRRATLSELLSAFPNMMSDPEHPSKPFLDVVNNYILHCILGWKNKTSGIVLAISFVLVLTARFWRKTAKRMRVFLGIGWILTITFFVSFYFTFVYINFLMFPFVVIGIFSFALSPKENLKEFLCFYVPGIMYGFCISSTSNQGFYVISTTAFVSLMGSLIMFIRTAKKAGLELSGKAKGTYKILITASLVFVLMGVAVVRYNSLFWEDAKMSQMTEKIEVGVNKGIYTTQQTKDMFTAEYEATKYVREYEGERVLYYTNRTYFYLQDEKKSAAFSAWKSGINQYSSDKLISYYELDESRMPDIVYCDPIKYYPEHSIYKFLLDNGYKCVESGNMHLYVR